MPITKEEIQAARVVLVDGAWDLVVEKVNELLRDNWSNETRNAWCWLSYIVPKTFLPAEADLLVQKITEEYTNRGWRVEKSTKDGKYYLQFT